MFFSIRGSRSGLTNTEMHRLYARLIGASEETLANEIKRRIGEELLDVKEIGAQSKAASCVNALEQVMATHEIPLHGKETRKSSISKQVRELSAERSAQAGSARTSRSPT